MNHKANQIAVTVQRTVTSTETFRFDLPEADSLSPDELRRLQRNAAIQARALANQKAGNLKTPQSTDCIIQCDQTSDDNDQEPTLQLTGLTDTPKDAHASLPGWTITQEAPDRITIEAEGLGFYVARMGSERIADIMLFALASDLLQTKPADAEETSTPETTQ